MRCDRGGYFITMLLTAIIPDIPRAIQPINNWESFHQRYLYLKCVQTANISYETAQKGQLKCQYHDDVIKWNHFPRYWPFVRGIHRSPVNSPHKGQWRGALMFSLICIWFNGWVNNRKVGDLRRYRAHYDVIVMFGDWWPCYNTRASTEAIPPNTQLHFQGPFY